MTKELVFFTVCNAAYLEKALALAASLHMKSDAILKIFLFEEDVIDFDQAMFFCEITLVKTLDIPNFYSLAFQYDVVELTTCLKPFIALSLLNDFNSVVFLDPVL